MILEYFVENRFNFNGNIILDDFKYLALNSFRNYLASEAKIIGYLRHFQNL